jgi:hypothetical protein
MADPIDQGGSSPPSPDGTSPGIGWRPAETRPCDPAVISDQAHYDGTSEKRNRRSVADKVAPPEPRPGPALRPLIAVAATSAIRVLLEALFRAIFGQDVDSWDPFN